MESKQIETFTCFICEKEKERSGFNPLLLSKTIGDAWLLCRFVIITSHLLMKNLIIQTNYSN